MAASFRWRAGALQPHIGQPGSLLQITGVSHRLPSIRPYFMRSHVCLPHIAHRKTVGLLNIGFGSGLDGDHRDLADLDKVGRHPDVVLARARHGDESPLLVQRVCAFAC